MGFSSPGTPPAQVILERGGLRVIQAQLGEWDNLNHLLVCEKTGEAAIVDPFNSGYWLQVCRENGWTLTTALLTHSHWDHSKGVEGLLSKSPDLQVWVHEMESLRGWEGPDTHRWTHPANTSTDFRVGELNFSIHCTPGHTPGHVTIIGNGVVISGDCLFLGRCGRTDLFGGDMKAQFESLKYLNNELNTLPDDWLVLPGHQYALQDGSNPTFTSVCELLRDNEALRTAGDWESFQKLEFLSFDDSMAEKARRQRARASDDS